MQRYIFFRLCRLLWYKPVEIRELTGLCEEHYRFKNQSLFIYGRPRNVPVSFRTISKNGITIAGNECIFTAGSGWRTVILGVPVIEGIFWWEVQIMYAQTSNSRFSLGAIPVGLLRWYRTSCLGSGAGTASFTFWQNSAGSQESLLYGVNDRRSIAARNIPVADGSLVAIEANSRAGSLGFFVDGRVVPCAITGMRFPVHLGRYRDTTHPLLRWYPSAAFLLPYHVPLHSKRTA